MAISEDQRILSIENRLNSLVARVSELERRLSELELSAGIERQPPRTRQPAPASGVEHKYLSRSIERARRDYERKYR